MGAALACSQHLTKRFGTESPAKHGGSHVSLGGEEGVKQVLTDAVLGLWDVVPRCVPHADAAIEVIRSYRDQWLVRGKKPG